jgi:hypothetical protein
VIGADEPGDIATIPDVSNTGEIIQMFYDVGRKVYWMENLRGDWIEINEASIKRHLQKRGLRSRKAKGESISEVDDKIVEIQFTQDVAYAGPLAGHRCGLIESYGNRVLVTTAPKLIVPVSGQWPLLDSIFSQLLFDSGTDQRPYVFGWLKAAVEALWAGQNRPGPLLALAGPRDCGKSLIQNVFTVILGGRVAKPYRYMSGRTDFNSELFGAEHLMIEDELPSTDIRARRNLGANIKAFTVNQTQSCHAKGRQAITLSPFWRVSLSVNNEPENLMILPPMTDSEQDSLADKVILLQAQKVVMPMPSEGLEERGAFWAALVAELPAFLDYLKHWTVPEELRHSRYGIKTYQHPDLLAALGELAPETRLLSLIDAVIFPENTDGGFVIVRQNPWWDGTAEQMERELCNSNYSREAAKLLSWHGAIGTYLGRIASKDPGRVRDGRTNKARRWIVYPPNYADEAGRAAA